jgi:hypothetical protein
MLFNDKVLFIHVPKTGGMATTSYLLKVLPGRKYYTAPQPDPDPAMAELDVRYAFGSRHETLGEARVVLGRLGYKLSDFSVIIAGARDPYAIEVSRYAYLHNGHSVDSGSEQDLAMSSDFATFVLKSDKELAAPIEQYYTVDERMPNNLRIVRLEHLDDDLSQVFREFGVPWTGPVLRDNESVHDDYRSYYTTPSEAVVYDRYRWVFDQGWYARLDLSKQWTQASGPRAAHKLPVSGCLHQVGPTSGAYSDGWIGDELRFRVSGDRGADYLTIEGSIPEGPQELSVQIGPDSFHGRFEAGPITWTLPCFILPSTPTLVTVSPSYTWVPADRIDGSRDTRSLSFVLGRLTFSSAATGKAMPEPEMADPSDALPSMISS